MVGGNIFPCIYAGTCAGVIVTRLFPDCPLSLTQLGNIWIQPLHFVVRGHTGGMTMQIGTVGMLRRIW